MKKTLLFASILLLVAAGFIATGCANATPSSASNSITMESPTTTVTQNFVFVSTNDNVLASLVRAAPVVCALGEKVVTVINVGVAGVYNRDSDANQTATPILQPVPIGDKPVQAIADTVATVGTKGLNKFAQKAVGASDVPEPVATDPSGAKPVTAISNGSQ